MNRAKLGLILLCLLTLGGIKETVANEALTLTGAQLLAAERAFFNLFRGEEPDKAIKQLEQLGLRASVNSSVWQFKDESKLGLGHYHIRRQAHNSSMIQAPHQFFDRHTGAIAQALFEEAPYTAMALNSISRKKTDASGHIYDLAHRDDTFFFSFTRAFIRAFPGSDIIQLHGFSQIKRSTPQGKQAAVILSLGMRFVDAPLQRTAGCLMQYYQGVFTYPNQVLELGGTRNTIGRLTRESAKARFVHIELNLGVRKQLTSSMEHRGQFYQCLNN